MQMRFLREISFVAALLLPLAEASAQKMTLDEAVAVARSQSVPALQARQEFISVYWQYRSYKASMLPSLSLYGALMNFDRSLTLLQSYEDGSFRYADTYSLQNTIGLRATQNISFTGGSLSLYSDLNRLDQFGNKKSTMWYSQPLNLRYYQPLFSYNKYKWAKMIEPKSYEAGKKKYLESMESVSRSVVKAYFDLILSEQKLQTAKTDFENTSMMAALARKRIPLGTVTRDEYLQLELKMLNDSLAVNEGEVSVREAQMSLNSLLGYDDSYEIEAVLDENLPEIYVDYDMVLDMAMNNSSFALDNEVSLLNAESDVAKAKAERGITMELNARFGLSQSGADFKDAYADLLDQEVVGLTFSIPIFDWGEGRGRVQKAKAAQEVAKAKVAQGESDRRRVIFTAVGQFNNQKQKCEVSKRAMEIASERYGLMMEKFRGGSVSVTELVNSQSDNDSAIQKHISDLEDFWTQYYSLRQYTLYDFIKGQELEINVEEMTEK